MKKSFFIFLLSFLSSLSINAKVFYVTSLVTKRRVVNVSSNAILTDIMNEGVKNTHYIIRNKHNLNKYRDGLIIGENCVLEFRKGDFNNGRLKCSNVVIEGQNPKFVDVYIEISNADCVELKNITATYTFAVDDFVKITDSRNIDVENVKVTFDVGNRQLPDGKWIFTEGFDITNCENISFKKCAILNAKSLNVDCKHGSLMCKSSRDIKLDSCFSSGGYNEVFNFYKCHNVTIENTVISSGNGSGITLDGGSDFVINNCKSLNVGASGFSLNAKNIMVSNCTIKNWKSYGGITVGHNLDGLRSGNVEISNCIIENDSGENHPNPIWAFGGSSEGMIKIHDCKTKTPRICTFDFFNNDDPVGLILKNNYIEVIKAEGPASTIECFRASGNFDLTIENNTFNGGAGIVGYVRPVNGQPVSNWKIKGNTFMNLGAMPIFKPKIKENVSDGIFVFIDNIIEDSNSLNDLIIIPKYAKTIVDGNKINRLKKKTFGICL